MNRYLSMTMRTRANNSQPRMLTDEEGMQANRKKGAYIFKEFSDDNHKTLAEYYKRVERLVISQWTNDITGEISNTCDAYIDGEKYGVTLYGIKDANGRRLIPEMTIEGNDLKKVKFGSCFESGKNEVRETAITDTGMVSKLRHYADVSELMK